MRHEVIDIPANGVRLRADERGDPDAPTVILLHGGGQTRHAWDETAVELAERGWRSIAVDQRGHGDSEWDPDGDYRPEAFAIDLRQVVAQVGGTPVLVGASLGGIASLLALGDVTLEGEPPVASGLVLVDVGHRLEPAGVERITWFMRSAPDGFGSLDEVADAIADYNPHRPRPADLSGLRKNLRQREDGRWVWHWDPRFLDGRGGQPPGEAGRTGLDQERLAASARRIAVPTLIVRGLLSDLLSPDGARELRALIPSAELVEVDGAGHMVAGDRNHLFNDAVVRFLDPILDASPSSAGN